MYIGKGNAYMREVARAVQEGYAAGILERRPTVVNLQCDVDHPTQSMADAMHLIAHFGGIEASYKPYIVAAMIFPAKVPRPADTLMQLLTPGRARVS